MTSKRLFILLAMAMSFLITMEASNLKAVSNSIFLSGYGASYLPLVWLCMIPLNFALVHLYSLLLKKFEVIWVKGIFVMCSIVINAISAFTLADHKEYSFALYVWKDIYILLLFQQLWSLIHSTIDKNQARSLYGQLFGIGGLGSVAGSIIPAFFATRYSSEKLLLANIPISIIALCTFTALYYVRIRSLKETHEEIKMHRSSDSKSIFEGFKLTLSSKTLLMIATIVIGMQISATLMDFQFNTYLESAYPIKDERTAFLGRLFGSVNFVTAFLQFVGCYMLIKAIGLKRVHLSVPFMILTAAAASMAFPVFSLVAIGFASVKCIDYSIFGVSKEMLYIPLSIKEKFHAKAFIDVFLYRTSKAFASFAILFLEYFAFASASLVVYSVIIALTLIWISIVWTYFQEERTLSRSSY